MTRHARGVCPDCGRTVAGSRRGQQPGWVALSPHLANPGAPVRVDCVPRFGARRTVRVAGEPAPAPAPARLP